MKLSPIILSLAMLAGSVCSADAGMNLDACFQAALKQSEAYASQKEVVIQAQETYNEAIGAIMPNINGSALWFQEDGHDLPSTIPQTANQTTYKVTADQPLFRGFRDFAALREAKDSVNYNDLSVQAAALILYANTAQAFYTVLALDKDLATQVDEVDLYNKRIDELKDFVRIGRSRETDILTVQASLALVKAQIEQSKGLAAVAREVFAFLTGLPKDTVLTDDKELAANMDTVDQYLSHVDSRPDIKAATQTLAMAKENVDVQWGQHLPSADLLGDYYFQRPVGLTQNVDWDVSIALTVPLFSGGVVSAQVNAAKSQLRQAELGLELYKRLAIQSLSSSYETVQFDLSQAQAYAEAFQLNEKNYKAEEEDYSNGLITNQDVLTALTSYQDAKRALDKAIFASKSDFATLESQAAKVTVPNLDDK